MILSIATLVMLAKPTRVSGKTNPPPPRPRGTHPLGCPGFFRSRNAESGARNSARPHRPSFCLGHWTLGISPAVPSLCYFAYFPIITDFSWSSTLRFLQFLWFSKICKKVNFQLPNAFFGAKFSA
jgi:hypothetical protein